jgi:hypothetical protein
LGLRWKAAKVIFLTRFLTHLLILCLTLFFVLPAKINQRNYYDSEAHGHHDGPTEEEDKGYGDTPKEQGHPSLEDILAIIAPFSGFVSAVFFLSSQVYCSLFGPNRGGLSRHASFRELFLWIKALPRMVVEEQS